MSKSYLSATIVVVAAIGVSACTVTPPHVSVSAPSVVLWAPVPPPAPRVEVIPPAPRHDYLWVSGHLHWEGNQHHWVDGHWEQHREGERWVAHHWDHDAVGQWRLNGGYWLRE